LNSSGSGYARWFSHGAFSLINRIAILGFGFINVMFMVRIVPKAEIGIWVLFTSVTSILEMMRAGFIRNPFITTLVSAAEKDRRSVITTSLALHFIVATSISAVLVILAIPLATFWKASGLDALFFIYALHNILLIPYLHFEYLQTTKLQFKAIFICNVVRMGILAIYIFVCFVIHKNVTLVELAVVQTIGTVVGTITGYPYVRDLLKLVPFIDKKLLSKLFHFGKYTFGTNISSMFMRSTDSWLIGRVISTSAVASYNPAIRLANLFEVPTLAIANFIFPQVAKKMKDHGKAGVRDIYVKSVSLMLALALPMIIPLYCFAGFFIEIIFGSEYLEAAPILRITAFYSIIIPFNRQFGMVLDGLGKPKLNFQLLVMTALLNVVLSYFLLGKFGLIGCAYGALLSYCILFTINQVILYRVFGIRVLKVFAHILVWYRTGWNLAFAKAIQVVR